MDDISKADNNSSEAASCESSSFESHGKLPPLSTSSENKDIADLFNSALNNFFKKTI